MSLNFIEGNEAVALGAMAAGCRFFAGYPITPATTIYQHMLDMLPPGGGICLQGEDEIASIGFCIGASMAGLKTMTATSGPGISLFSEQISFAIAGEIPLVIVDVQRLALFQQPADSLGNDPEIGGVDQVRIQVAETAQGNGVFQFLSQCETQAPVYGPSGVGWPGLQ